MMYVYLLKEAIINLGSLDFESFAISPVFFETKVVNVKYCEALIVDIL